MYNINIKEIVIYKKQYCLNRKLYFDKNNNVIDKKIIIKDIVF